MKKVRVHRLVLVLFVSLIVFLANRGIFAAVIIENILLSLFTLLVLFIAIKASSVIYAVFLKRDRS
ncbi:MAG: hypothetical protein EA249_09685 [Alkalibacterium sp.]|nr:MAG: hypothetical protein EA249_09685 [Alkalibacterium sp.]